MNGRFSEIFGLKWINTGKNLGFTFFKACNGFNIQGRTALVKWLSPHLHFGGRLDALTM